MGPKKPTRFGMKFDPRISTWRIIPVSKWLVTPIYKPFRSFGRGITSVRGLTITMVINHLLTGMILQVGFAMSNTTAFWCLWIPHACPKRSSGVLNLALLLVVLVLVVVAGLREIVSILSSIQILYTPHCCDAWKTKEQLCHELYSVQGLQKS